MRESCQYSVQAAEECKKYIPVQALGVGNKPIPASTQTAQVVKQYTKARGKYVTTLQQYRSHFLAQGFRRTFIGGGDGDDDGASVDIPARQTTSAMYVVG